MMWWNWPIYIYLIYTICFITAITYLNDNRNRWQHAYGNTSINISWSNHASMSKWMGSSQKCLLWIQPQCFLWLWFLWRTLSGKFTILDRSELEDLNARKSSEFHFSIVWDWGYFLKFMSSSHLYITKEKPKAYDFIISIFLFLKCFIFWPKIWI